MVVDRPVKVILADDHAIVRAGISELLGMEESIKVVGEASNGAEAVELAREKKPDVVLLDVEMPVMGAKEAIGQILAASPSSKVVILTTFEDPGLVRDLMTLGASAYLVKSLRRQELVSSIISVAHEDRVVLSISKDALAKLNGEDEVPISKRELEVLMLAARGMSNRQVASALYLTEGTIKRHLSNIYVKLGVASRVEATRKALLEGWITTRDIGDFE